MNFENLISRCIAEMDAKNLTNKDVARIAKISESTVSRTLSSNAQNASVATLCAICDALELEIDGQHPAKHVSVEDVYEARIEDLKRMIVNKDRWLWRVSVACAVLVLFILVLLAVDIANPSVGWIRSALGFMARARRWLL